MFPSFQLNQLFGSIAGGGEVTWKSFHDLFERDCSLDANLHKAPGSCKNSVLETFASFDETIVATIRPIFQNSLKLRIFFLCFKFSGSHLIQNAVYHEELLGRLCEMRKWKARASKIFSRLNKI